MAMTNYERMKRTLARQPVDEIPVAVSLWGATVERYRREGRLQEGEDLITHFDQAYRGAGWLTSVADLDFEPVTLEETEETILQLDGNGAKLRRHKLHDSTPEHVDFTVKDRAGWEKHIKDKLQGVDRRRIGFDYYRQERQAAKEQQRYFCWTGVAPFEQMHPVCGHEYMLMGMALEPDWVKDMVQTYVDMTIRHLDLLFGEEGKPDALFFYEDMGFKGKPFMSPAMYEDILMPGHQRLFSYAHDLGCPVIVHSCGYVEPLLPGLIRAGMDCLQAMEVKAGMDMPHLFEMSGDKISFFGNIDVRVLIANDKAAVEEELRRKIVPVVSAGGGYILHTDHSEPPEIDYETMCFFLEKGREIARQAMKRT